MKPTNLLVPPWAECPEDIDTLVDRYGTISNAELGASLTHPRTAGAVQGKAYQLGITDSKRSRKRHDNKKRKRVLILAMRDYSLAEMAAELGTAKLWVQRVLEAHPYYHRKWKEKAKGRRSRCVAEGKRRKAANG